MCNMWAKRNIRYRIIRTHDDDPQRLPSPSRKTVVVLIPCWGSGYGIGVPVGQNCVACSGNELVAPNDIGMSPVI